MKGVKAQNIYIFSKTAKFDLTYRPIIMYILENTTGKLKNVYDEINFDVIESVMNYQGNIMLSNMSLEKNMRRKLDKYLFIFDDVIGDEQLKSY